MPVNDPKYVAKLVEIIKRLFELEKNTILGRLNLGVTALMGLVFLIAFMRSCADPIIEGIAYKYFDYIQVQETPTLALVGKMLFKIFLACGILLLLYDMMGKWLNEKKQ